MSPRQDKEQAPTSSLVAPEGSHRESPCEWPALKVPPGADTPGDRDRTVRAPTSNTWLADHFPVRGRREQPQPPAARPPARGLPGRGPFSLSTGVLAALLELEADFNGRGQDGLEVQDLTANPVKTRTEGKS